MLLGAFDNYITELMEADVSLSSGRLTNRCVYNGCRTRRQYIRMWLQLYRKLVEELQNADIQLFQREYFSTILLQAGEMFVREETEVVCHRNLLIRCGEVIVSGREMDDSFRRLLQGYLKIQYDAWVRLKDLFDSYLSVYRGHHLWTGQEIELLELGDALWMFGKVKPVSSGETKRWYFKRLFGYFNLPIPERPCHRLGEIGRRSRPHSFLYWLQGKYRDHWSNQDLK